MGFPVRGLMTWVVVNVNSLNHRTRDQALYLFRVKILLAILILLEKLARTMAQ